MKKITQSFLLLLLAGSLILSSCQTIKGLSVSGAKDLLYEIDTIESFFNVTYKIVVDILINGLILGLLLSLVPGLNGFRLGSLISVVGYWYYVVENRDYGFWVVLAMLACIGIAATILNALTAIILTRIMTLWYTRQERKNLG